MGDKTTHPVKVSRETWKELNARKEPGDTFDDVVSRLLDSDRVESEPSA